MTTTTGVVIPEFTVHVAIKEVAEAVLTALPHLHREPRYPGGAA